MENNNYSYPLTMIINDIQNDISGYRDPNSKKAIELQKLNDKIIENYEVIERDIKIINDLCNMFDDISSNNESEKRKMVNKKFMSEDGDIIFNDPFEAYDYITDNIYSDYPYFINDDDFELISSGIEELEKYR